MLRKKRLVRLALIFAVALVALASVLQGVLAAEPVFDGTVLSGYKYTTTMGDQFSLVSVAPLSKVAIDLPGESLIVENKSCSTGKIFEACYDGATFKGYNHSLVDREVYEFRIKINLVAPEIKVTKSLDKTQLDVGESTIVHVNITNIGEAQGAVRFTETVPSQLRIIELPDQPCQLSASNTLTMTANLKGGEIRRCSYKITALDSGAYTLASAASYDLIKRETATATAIVAVNPLPLSVAENISNSSLLGDSLNMSFLLETSASLESFIFNVFVPEGIKVISVNKEAGLENNEVELEKQVSGVRIVYGNKITELNGSVLIKIASQAEHAGTVAVSANASWVYNGLNQGMIKDIIVNVTLAQPYLRLAKYDNETEKLSMELVNPAHRAIYQVAVIPATASGNAVFSASEVEASSHASFSDSPTQLQGLGSSQASYNGTIVYHTSYGQELSAKFGMVVNRSRIYTATPAAENNEAIAEAGSDNSANATESESPKLEKPPKTKLPAAEIKAALVMVGMIILLIGLFLLIRNRGGSYSEEARSDDELRN